MIEIVFRYDPEAPPEPPPSTPADARALLERGNLQFARLLEPGSLEAATSGARPVLAFNPSDYGIGDGSGKAPKQAPFAAVLGCADARVPIEIVFEQGCNDLFVVRVAGNVVGSECLGSLSYATHHFPSLRLIVVLGHLHCGAVSAAVESYLKPGTYLSLATNYPIQGIVSSILPSVTLAALCLRRVHGLGVLEDKGYEEALVELSVVMNAAWAAYNLKHELADREGGLEVLFSVYDLVSRHVRLPLAESAQDGSDLGLFEPPADERGFEELGDRVAAGPFIRSILDRP
jgi:carbonic anhydrase